MKLNHTLALIIAAAALVAGGAVLMSQNHLTEQTVPNNTPWISPIPPPFTQLKIGMTEDQVMSMVGSPIAKTVYPEYVCKTPADWAKIQEEVAAAGSPTDNYGGAINMTLVKEKTELTHRYHDIWYYVPRQGMYINLYMNDDKTLGTIIGDPASVSPPKTSAPKQ